MTFWQGWFYHLSLDKRYEDTGDYGLKVGQTALLAQTKQKEGSFGEVVVVVYLTPPNVNV